MADAESAMTDEERDIENEEFWRNLASIFTDAQTMLSEKAEELGIESEPVDDEKFARYKEREEEFVENQELTRLAQKYWKESRKTLEETDEWLIFSALDEDAQNEMLSILHWYQFFISTKIQRGFQGLVDFDGNFDEEELNDSQSDANGSIKIAMIAVERSIMAWTALMTAENSAYVKPQISLLENIKQKADIKFPNAHDFVRPGFDEIETVM